MTLQASGAIAISDINVELGRAWNNQSNLNESALRTLAGVPSGAISLANFYGKSNFSATWSGNSIYAVDAYLYGFQVSGGSWRGYAKTTSEYFGSWISTYTDGTFSTTVSNPFGTTIGIETSGNTARGISYYFGTTHYGSWMPFSISSGWSGSSIATAPAYFNLSSSGGAIRCQQSNDSAYAGPWVTLT
jgi:hypothetical protein